MKKYFAGIISVISFLFLTSCVNDSGPGGTVYEWIVSTPAELGMDENLINSGFNAAQDKLFINAIVIVRHGKIAAEKYFNGRDRYSNQTVRSVSKSFLSALYGIAIEKDLISADEKIIDFFPEYKSSVTDPRVNSVTLDQLMKMRAGFKGDEEFYFTFTTSSDWVKTILSSSLNFDPETKMGYSTAGTHLLAAALAKATGKDLMEFGNSNLFIPAGIAINDWLKDPQGYRFGGNDMYFTPRNMAVLGLIYLNGGVINGKEIVPANWVGKSIVSYSGASSGSWGKLSKYGYGLMWWTGELAGLKIYTALGHGGQYIMCVPALDMIITVQSFPDSDWNTADIQERGVMDIIAGYIIPAVKGN